MNSEFDKQFDTKSRFQQQATRYCSILGSLLCLAVKTRPYIAATASKLGCKVAKPTVSKMAAAKYALRYLCGSANMCIVLAPRELNQLSAYVNAD